MRFSCASFFAVALIALMPLSVDAAMSPQERAALEAQLAQVEAEIKQNQTQLSLQREQRASYERDVAILDSQIRAAQLGIKARNLRIKELKSDAADKQRGIQSLDSKVADGQKSIAQILRQTREIDDVSLAQIVLSGSLSDLFREVDNFEMVQRALDASFAEMAVARTDLSERKKALDAQQLEEQELLQIQVLEQNTLKRIEKQKQDLVTAARGQEAVYLQLIANKQQTAAQIRSALFNLRDSGAIPFGTAYQYAKEASAATGVRPALILGVLRQETNLGENVGQCLLTNSPNKGDGKGKNTGTPFSRVMKPDRDVDPFMQITSELGINPFAQVVSCPQSIGYGGAMGPAQFIPSTWILYKDRLAKITGTNPPDPWHSRTAIFATALLMADNGADGGTRASERLAALRYFAGWANAKKASYAFYGDGVMGFADDYQKDIDILEGR